MKKLFYLLLLTPIIYLASCSSSPDLSPTTTSLHGTWQYDSWLLDGDELLNDYVSYLSICEDSGYWLTQIFDIEGNMTSNSQAGSFTINDDQTEGVFTVELVYDAINGWLILDLPQTFSVSIYKLDDNELDFSFQYAGHTEIIESVKTPTEPTCSYNLVTLVSGCTDSLAINYNSLATTEDGSCEYSAALDCMGIESGTAIIDDCNDCHKWMAYNYITHAVREVNDTTNEVLGENEMFVSPNNPMNPLWNACYIQDVYVNINLDLNLPEYSDLQAPGSSIFIEGGVKGIIIYHGVGSDYKVYDRNCSYEPSLSCSQIDTVDAGIAYCGCCPSAFLLSNNANVLNSPALLPLKAYYWTLDDNNILRIFN